MTTDPVAVEQPETLQETAMRLHDKPYGALSTTELKALVADRRSRARERAAAALVRPNPTTETR